jgi:hypothetical protein
MIYVFFTAHECGNMTIHVGIGTECRNPPTPLVESDRGRCCFQYDGGGTEFDAIADALEFIELMDWDGNGELVNYRSA